MSKPWFDSIGFLIRKIPKQCVKECSHPGPCDDDVSHWIDKLNFSVPRELAINYLEGFGSWSRNTDECDRGLADMTDRELAEKVLWLACGDIQDQGEWLGVIT